MVITKDLIESVRSVRGGHTRFVLMAMGVEWPPQHGWPSRIINTEIPDDTFVDDPLHNGKKILSPETEVYLKIQEQKEIKEERRIKKEMIDAVGLSYKEQLQEERQRQLQREVRRGKRHPKKQNLQEFSYVIGALGTSRVKIGKTTDLKKRLGGIQTGCPYELVVLATTPMKEKKLHQMFGRYSVGNGEWFEWSDKLSRLLTSNSNVEVNPDGMRQYCLSLPKEKSECNAVRPLKYNNPQRDVLREVWKRIHG